MDSLTCLTGGQGLVVANKVYEHFGPIRFLESVPNRFFSSLVMDNFYELASSVSDAPTKISQMLEEKFWESTFTGFSSNVSLSLSLPLLFGKDGDDHCGQYYKHLTIVNYESRVVIYPIF